MSQMYTPPASRNYGIDLLRMVSMLMICVIHMNMFSLAHLKKIPTHEFVYYFANWTESVGIIGVNLYALITGYVCIQSKWRFSRYCRLWVLVAFYTVVIALVGWVLYKNGVVNIPSYILHYGKTLFFGSTYWYFAAYTGLFFLMPALNAALLNLPRDKYNYLVLALVIVLPFLNKGTSGVLMHAGYNMVWLCSLYVVGAYLKLYQPIRCRILPLLAVSICCTLISLVCKSMHINVQVFAYTMLNNVIYSLALFVVFIRIRIDSPFWRRFISIMAPASFSVYLIQCHPWLWNLLCEDMFAFYQSLNHPWWFSLVFGLALYLACSCIDFVRIALFRICRVDVVSDYIAGVIERMVKGVLPKLKRMLE